MLQQRVMAFPADSPPRRALPSPTRLLADTIQRGSTTRAAFFSDNIAFQLTPKSGSLDHNTYRRRMLWRFRGLFGSRTRERALKFLGAIEQSYPREMSVRLDEHLSVMQRTLNQLELDGVLASRLFGNVRIFEFNRTYQH